MTDPHVTAARVRAALAYANLTYADASAGTPLSVSTLRRIASVTNPRGADDVELAAIAQACDVPPAWLGTGVWEPHALVPSQYGFGDGDEDARLRTAEVFLAQLVAISRVRGDLP